MRRRHSSDVVNRIKNARGCLAVHHGHVRDARVVAQPLIEPRGVNLFVFSPFEGAHLAAHDARDLHHPCAVGTIDEDQQMAARRKKGRDRRLDREGTRTLERNADVGRAGANEISEALTHFVVHRNERGVA